MFLHFTFVKYILIYVLEYIQPTYVNMHELASMASNKAQERNANHNVPHSNLNLKVILLYKFIKQ